LIDLHTHTDESDGTLTPAQLVAAAIEQGLEALGITDHDTFAGYLAGLDAARQAGLPLVCGIELSTKFHGRSVHLLGYFLEEGAPPAPMRAWLDELQESRRDRNRRLVAKLQSLGVDVQLREVEALGRSLTGRPHFARLLIAKGYVTSYDEAFRVFLDESAQAYVERRGPDIEEAIRRIRDAGGISSLAHPIRLARIGGDEEQQIRELCGFGLQAIEVYHSDHSPEVIRRYETYARKYALAVTGGSDFHGIAKPDVRLGSGRGNVVVPLEVLQRLRDGVPYLPANQ
jgi:predicted metal-dependent phosphoesterase TrpH